VHKNYNKNLSRKELVNHEIDGKLGYNLTKLRKKLHKELRKDGLWILKQYFLI